MLTTAPTGSLEVWAAAQTLRVVAVAPPTATAPPASLGGLHQVQRLVEGLAERGHQVTLIGRGLGELTGGGYSVIDTDPTGCQPASRARTDAQCRPATRRSPIRQGRHGAQAIWGGWRSPSISSATPLACHGPR